LINEKIQSSKISCYIPFKPCTLKVLCSKTMEGPKGCTSNFLFIYFFSKSRMKYCRGGGGGGRGYVEQEVLDFKCSPHGLEQCTFLRFFYFLCFSCFSAHLPYKAMDSFLIIFENEMQLIKECSAIIVLWIAQYRHEPSEPLMVKLFIFQTIHCFLLDELSRGYAYFSNA